MDNPDRQCNSRNCKLPSKGRPNYKTGCSPPCYYDKCCCSRPSTSPATVQTVKFSSICGCSECKELERKTTEPWPENWREEFMKLRKMWSDHSKFSECQFDNESCYSSDENRSLYEGCSRSNCKDTVCQFEELSNRRPATAEETCRRYEVYHGRCDNPRDSDCSIYDLSYKCHGQDCLENENKFRNEPYDDYEEPIKPNGCSCSCKEGCKSYKSIPPEDYPETFESDEAGRDSYIEMDTFINRDSLTERDSFIKRNSLTERDSFKDRSPLKDLSKTSHERYQNPGNVESEISHTFVTERFAQKSTRKTNEPYRAMKPLRKGGPKKLKPEPPDKQFAKIADVVHKKTPHKKSSNKDAVKLSSLDSNTFKDKNCSEHRKSRHKRSKLTQVSKYTQTKSLVNVRTIKSGAGDLCTVGEMQVARKSKIVNCLCEVNPHFDEIFVNTKQIALHEIVKRVLESCDNFNVKFIRGCDIIEDSDTSKNCKCKETISESENSSKALINKPIKSVSDNEIFQQGGSSFFSGNYECLDKRKPRRSWLLAEYFKSKIQFVWDNPGKKSPDKRKEKCSKQYLKHEADSPFFQ